MIQDRNVLNYIKVFVCKRISYSLHSTQINVILTKGPNLGLESSVYRTNKGRVRHDYTYDNIIVDPVYLRQRF